MLLGEPAALLGALTIGAWQIAREIPALEGGGVAFGAVALLGFVALIPGP